MNNSVIDTVVDISTHVCIVRMLQHTYIKFLALNINVGSNFMLKSFSIKWYVSTV